MGSFVTKVITTDFPGMPLQLLICINFWSLHTTKRFEKMRTKKTNMRIISHNLKPFSQGKIMLKQIRNICWKNKFDKIKYLLWQGMILLRDLDVKKQVLQ